MVTLWLRLLQRLNMRVAYTLMCDQVKCCVWMIGLHDVWIAVEAKHNFLDRFTFS